MLSRRLAVEPLQGYEPEIGHWMWAMQEVRRRTLRLVKDLDQRTLDWEGPDERENAIGSLLHHIALVEMSWLFMDILCQALPPHVEADFPHEMSDAQGRLARVPGVLLADHLARLEGSREIFLNAFRGMAIDEWRRIRKPPDDVDYEVSPEWAVFHLVEHEAGHAFQISSLKARAARRFGAKLQK